MTDSTSIKDITKELQNKAIYAVIEDLERKGYEVRKGTVMDKNGLIRANYLRDNFIFCVTSEVIRNPVNPEQMEVHLNGSLKQNHLWPFHARVILSEGGKILIINYEPLV